jgi:hypothetical protein
VADTREFAPEPRQGCAGLCALYTAFLGTIVTFHLQKEETLRTIRLKETIMAILALILLGACIAYVRLPDWDRQV